MQSIPPSRWTENGTERMWGWVFQVKTKKGRLGVRVAFGPSMRRLIEALGLFFLALALFSLIVAIEGFAATPSSPLFSSISAWGAVGWFRLATLVLGGRYLTDE